MCMKKIKKGNHIFLLNLSILISIAISLGSIYHKQGVVYAAVAPGCSASRPTAITGSITAYGGDYHSWTVNVLIGIDLHNSSGAKVKPDGSTLSGSPYSYVEKVNVSLAPPGLPSGGERTYGANQADGNGVLCVASSVKEAWFELYPKDEDGHTVKTYYGGANDQRMPLASGTTNKINLRLPVSHAYNGNTGDINGFVKYAGNPINPGNLKFRVFPTTPGTSCGVQGFSAGADKNVINNDFHANYYLIKNIAGGQCGASTQTYKLIVSCINSACGSGTKSITRDVKVGNGARPRVDIRF